MRNSPLKWVLVSTLLIVVAILAYVSAEIRIEEMQQQQQSRPAYQIEHLTRA